MTVRHNAAEPRYELDTDHGLAIAVYPEQGGRAIFTTQCHRMMTARA